MSISDLTRILAALLPPSFPHSAVPSSSCIERLQYPASADLSSLPPPALPLSSLPPYHSIGCAIGDSSPSSLTAYSPAITQASLLTSATPVSSSPSLQSLPSPSSYSSSASSFSSPSLTPPSPSLTSPTHVMPAPDDLVSSESADRIAAASSPSPSSAAAASSSAASSPPPSSSHTTDWSDVNLGRFCFWMSLFSIAENFVFYPFYLLKTREQADRSANYRALDSARHHLQSIMRKEGFRGMYRGFAASSVVALPAYGIYSGVYTWAKEGMGHTAKVADALSSSSSSSSPSSASLQHSTSSSSSSFAERHPLLVSFAAPFVAGLVADAASIILYVPGDVIVQRLQVLNSPYKSFTDAVRRIGREEGLRGFYRGFGATFVTSAIASAIWWMVYEQSKQRLYAWDSSRQQHTAGSSTAAAAAPSSRDGGVWAAMTEVNRLPQLAAGFIAGTVTSSVINPLDVVKTRLQVQDSAKAATVSHAQSSPPASPPARYRNFIHGLRQVYVEEGMRGFARGLVPKLVSRGPMSAASSLMYELVLYLSRDDQKRGAVQQDRERERKREEMR